MISQQYVLFTRIPIARNASGRLFTDPLWAKDLKIHLTYIKNFSLCCPVTQSDNSNGLSDITDCEIKRVFPLRKDRGITSALINVLPNFIGVVRACRAAEIVHSSGAGWAFPLSFYLLPLKYFFKFKWVMVIESSFWMLSANEQVTPSKLFDHFIHEILLTKCVRKADARVFTQSFYRQHFLGSETKRTLISPATWIDEDLVVTPASVKKRHQLRTSGPLRIIFPSRLVSDKGIFVVISSLRELEQRQVPIHLTIMGTGKHQGECQAFAMEHFKYNSVRYSPPVEYGEIFFKTLGDYDFVLVANLKEEQPRIIFDAFSQGVGVIASCTTGVLDITDKANAATFKTGSATSLADVITHLNRNRQQTISMGLEGLSFVTGKTHRQMHIDRERFLKSIFSAQSF